MTPVVRWTLSQDACAELRRRVHQQRIDRGDAGTIVRPDLLGAEHAVIVEFLREEFGDWVAEGHEDCVAPDRLPDVRSWQYPGEWTTPELGQLSQSFGESAQAFLFSNSGSYNIVVEKLLLVE